MASKNNPGRFDCYANAEPDEPMFVLLGRDRHAPVLVALWSVLREQEGEDVEKVREAIDCSNAMYAWLDKLGKSSIGIGDVAQATFNILLQRARDIQREHEQLLALTRTLDEHPEDYDGPCECRTCMQYAAGDAG